MSERRGSRRTRRSWVRAVQLARGLRACVTRSIWSSPKLSQPSRRTLTLTLRQKRRRAAAIPAFDLAAMKAEWSPAHRFRGWRLGLNLATLERMSGRAKRQGSAKSRLRQALLVLLAAVYVLVGFGGEISCAEEALEIIPYSTADATAGSDKADIDGKKTPTVVDHCYTCVPLTVPAAASVCAPAVLSGIVCSRCSTILALEARLLDTPPPKAQI